jgi:hypothetical protein
MDSVAERDQVRAARWQEKQDDVMDRSRCRVAAHAGVCTRGLWRFTIKSSGYLVDPQNQDRRLDGRRCDPGASRTFDVGGHAAGSRGLRREDGDCGEKDHYLTILPLRGVCLPLCSKGSLVICPTRRDFIYIALGFQGNSSIRTASHFPCSLG